MLVHIKYNTQKRNVEQMFKKGNPYILTKTNIPLKMYWNLTKTNIPLKMYWNLKSMYPWYLSCCQCVLYVRIV